MPLLLNIDSATEVASVCISSDANILQYRENRHQKEHASFIHGAVAEILEEAKVRLEDVEAFSVTAGPGSYTGLRVAMAAAKGFCYAFTKPLITINTLQAMAHAALHALPIGEQDWLCPMLDARRMEVFTALYDVRLQTVVEPQAMILDEQSFADYIAERKIVFFGSGSTKFRHINPGKNAIFADVTFSAKNLAHLALQAFEQKKFEDVSYSEPNYLKDFQLASKR